MDNNQDAYQKKLEFVQALSQLESKEKEIRSSQKYRGAYFWSLIAPPIGVYYFVRYLFFEGEKEGSIQAGVLSLILTIISLSISVLFLSSILKQTTSSTSPADLQMLKDLANPKNQKTILQLYK